MLTLISIQNSSAHQVWPRIPYTYMRIRSLRDQASRSDQIRSSESDDAIPDPDPDPMIGSFDPNHDSTGQDDFSSALGFTYQLDNTEMGKLEYGSLSKTNAQTIVTEMGRLGDSHIQDLGLQIVRQEQWNQVALVQAEIFGDNPRTRPFIHKLIDEVSNRLSKAQTRTLGNQPPWGYRCLDHSLRIELTISKANLEGPKDEIRESIQSAYTDCSYFLQSNFSFVKSWNTTDPTWTREFWDLDCTSYVCSSFLGVATLKWSNTPTGNGGQLPRVWIA